MNLFVVYRVPLMIAHPQSPFHGQHYKDPVELIDVFATVSELLKAPYNKKKIYEGMKMILPQGKSLAPVVLGKEFWERSFPEKKGTVQFRTPLVKGNQTAPLAINEQTMPLLQQNFAISQALRCAEKSKIPKESSIEMKSSQGNNKRPPRPGWLIWTDCNIEKKDDPNEVSLIGYSFRTPEYKYIAYFHLNRTNFVVDLINPPYQQELYDHKNETLADFTHREIVNLAFKPAYAVTVNQLKAKLIHFIKNNIVFKK